ncbi:MAG: hypothetical protein COA94_05955 [Rickettsiales bacterium]|nr:MAG: hypothetical protein COA94_05955 [Rickettsiales bacterium]
MFPKNTPKPPRLTVLTKTTLRLTSAEVRLALILAAERVLGHTIDSDASVSLYEEGATIQTETEDDGA